MKAFLTKPLLFCVLIGLVLISLTFWQAMPIYPDEYALRMQVGRFIQDRGQSSLLFSLCLSSIKSVPLLFVTPAWLFSQLDLHFTSVQIRILPFVVVASCFLATAYYALRNINPFASLWMAAAIIGVACSSLVFARYESIMLINVLFGVLALHVLSYRNPPALQRGVVAACLMASALTSLYVHPQGIMLLPFTAYLSYRLITPDGFDIKMVCLWGLATLFIAYSTHAFHSLSCSEYPSIEAYVADMAFKPESLHGSTLIEYMTDKLMTYVQAFTYSTEYSVSYLPGISAEKISTSNMAPALNIAIPIIVIGVATLNVLVCIGLGMVAFHHYLIKRKRIVGINTDAVIAYFLLVLPVIFLFFYDAKQSFYRSIAIHFLFTVALVVILSNVRYGFVAKLSAGLGGLICVICISSISANHSFFDKELATYEGPGVSVSRNLVQLQSKVQDLAKSCGIDFTKGGGVIDDLTYDSVKQYHKVYPITYMGLQMGLIKASASDVIKQLKPNYVLARCTVMQATGIGWPADVNSGELCCTRLNK